MSTTLGEGYFVASNHINLLKDPCISSDSNGGLCASLYPLGLPPKGSQLFNPQDMKIDPTVRCFPWWYMPRTVLAHLSHQLHYQEIVRGFPRRTTALHRCVHLPFNGMSRIRTHSLKV